MTISVLIADDHPVFRSGLSKLIDDAEELELVGIAADGTDAVSLARQRRPDVGAHRRAKAGPEWHRRYRAHCARMPRQAILTVAAGGAALGTGVAEKLQKLSRPAMPMASFPTLTSRERQILDEIARGRSNAEARHRGPHHLRRPAQLGGSVHDPTDPVGRLPFNVLTIIAEFEADLVKLRTREGMKIVRTKGRLHGVQPKLTRLAARVLALDWRATQTCAPGTPTLSLWWR
jgi:hypothetical protein